MPDTILRAALAERSTALRARATSFSSRLTDERARQFVRAHVLNRLDDVDRLFLGDPNTRPSMEMWESMWLDAASRLLAIAEESFNKFEAQAECYGGPERVRLIG